MFHLRHHQGLRRLILQPADWRSITFIQVQQFLPLCWNPHAKAPPLPCLHYGDIYKFKLYLFAHLPSVITCAFTLHASVYMWICESAASVCTCYTSLRTLNRNQPTTCFMLPLWSSNGFLVFLCLLGACSYKQLILSCVFMSGRKYCYSSSWVSVASGSLAVLIHYKPAMTVERMKAKRRGSCNVCVHSSTKAKSADGNFIRCFKLSYHWPVSLLKGKVKGTLVASKNHK